jgi:lipopolysaccharide transport system permease protein
VNRVLEVRINSASGGTGRRSLLPHRLIAHFWRLRGLVWRLAVRDFLARNRGSYLGLLWAAITPLSLLLIYTFVFGFVFKARWGKEPGNIGLFAAMLLCGIVPYSLLFGDAVGRAPLAVIGQPNFVTRVVFPVETLPASVVGAACLQFLGGFVIMLIGALAVRHTLTMHVLLTPAVLLPLILLATGLTYLLASIGVFVRDMANTVQIGLTLLFFLSPIFYQLENLPLRARFYLRLNPLTAVVEGLRAIVMRGRAPDWPWLGYSLAVSLVVAYLGVVWFMRTKKAFADVL